MLQVGEAFHGDINDLCYVIGKEDLENKITEIFSCLEKKKAELNNEEEGKMKLDSFKLSEILVLKEDLDPIYGKGIFEQSVGEAVNSLEALLLEKRRRQLGTIIVKLGRLRKQDHRDLQF